jgi:hypothetical protein
MISASLGPLAQVVEQEAFNLCVIGSNPIRPTKFKCFILSKSLLLGPLAQVVEQEAFNLCVIGSNPIRPTILVIPYCARSSAG